MSIQIHGISMCVGGALTEKKMKKKRIMGEMGVSERGSTARVMGIVKVFIRLFSAKEFYYRALKRTPL